MAKTITPHLFLAPCIVLGGTVGALGMWAATLPMQPASIAPGTVQATGERQPVQSATDGKVAELLVGEGATVEAGQVLLRFDPVEARAAVDRLLGRLFVATATRARALAALALDDRIAAVQPVTGSTDPRWPAALRTQAAILKTTIDDLRRHHADIDRQAAEAGRQLDALQAERTAVQHQLDLAGDALGRLTALHNKKIATRAAVSEAEGRCAALRARLARLDAERAEIRRSLTALSGRKQAREAGIREAAGRTLDAMEARLLDLEPDLMQAQAALDHQEVRSPATGRVFQLAVRTRGAVVRRGMVLAEIVPAEGAPVVLAKLDPRDADSVTTGDPARVRLTGANPRRTLPLNGVVRRVAPDASLDPAGGRYHEVEITLRDAAAGRSLRLVSGAPAEVIVLGPPRTVWQSLAAPLAAAADRAMREQ